MPDAFFQRKRKRAADAKTPPPASSSSHSASRSNGRPSAVSGRTARGSKAGPSGPTRRPRRGGDRGDRDDELDDRAAARADDIDDMDLSGGEAGDTNGIYDDEDEAEAEETPAEARVRLAKMYLEGLKKDAAADETEVDAAAIDADNIAHRLRGDVERVRSTRIHVRLAALLAAPRASDVLGLGGARGGGGGCSGGAHAASVTGVAVSQDGSRVFSCAKDGSVVVWSAEDGRVECAVPATRRTGKPLRPGGRAKSSTSGAARRRRRNKLAAIHVGGHDDDAGAPADGDGAGSTTAAARPTDTRFATRLQLRPEEGHTGEVLAVAVSPDGRLLATAGRDRRVGVWRIETRLVASPSVAANGVVPSPSSAPASSSSSPAPPPPPAATTDRGEAPTASRAPRRVARLAWLRGLGGHRDAVTSVGFRQARGSSDLFSCSLDRTLRLHDSAQLSYVESLFGHQEGCVSLDVLRGEVAVSVAGRDRTARWWKVRDESQLVFRGGAKSKVRQILEGGELLDDDATTTTTTVDEVEGSLESVAMIDEHSFLTGGDTGAISLWSLSKKKPVFVHAAAHGYEAGHDGAGGGGDGAPADQRHTVKPRWITSLACLPYGDVFASGSWDGRIRVWSLDVPGTSAPPTGFSALFDVRAPGFVNALRLVQPKGAGGGGGGAVTVRPEAWRPGRIGGLGAGGGAEEGTGRPRRDRGGSGAAAGKRHGDAAAAAAPAAAAAVTTNGHGGRRAGVKARGRRGAAVALLAAGLGQEPRLGRWSRLQDARNGVVLVPLRLAGGEGDDGEGDEDEGDDDDDDDEQGGYDEEGGENDDDDDDDDDDDEE